MNHLNYHSRLHFIYVCIGLLLLFSAGCSSNNISNGTSLPHLEYSLSESSDGNVQDGSSDIESLDNNSLNSVPGPDSAPIDNNGLSQYLSDQDTLMSEMMEQMAVEPSGNASADFLRGMIPHHNSAIEMAQAYLKYNGAEPELKQMAQDIIKTQSEEIEEMNRLIQEIETSGETDEEAEQAYLDAYASMMSDHSHISHQVSDPEDLDQAFAQGMIMHHQMAVDMARAILDCTEEKAISDLAESIIQTQVKEIEKMEEILNRS